MGRKIIFLLIFFVLYAFSNGADAKIAIFKFSDDINGDGKKELIVHDLYEGNAADGQIRIYDPDGKLIFIKKVQGIPLYGL